MPVLYLEPRFGVGNRLIMMVSALRFCNTIGYDLEVLWDNGVLGYGSERHFYDCIDAYFDIPCSFSSAGPKGRSVFIPRSLSEARYVIDPVSFQGQDVLISGWTHFILHPLDLTGENQGESIAFDLRSVFNEFFVPKPALRDFSGQVLGLDLFTVSTHTRLFDLGVHIRQGGFQDKKDVDLSSINGRTWSISDYSDLFTILQASKSENPRVFVCGVAADEIAKVSALSRSFGYPTFTVFDNCKESIKLLFPFGLESEARTLGSDLQMYFEFLLLSRSAVISTWAPSTFGAFAALLGDNIRIIKNSGKLVIAGSQVFSGSGL